MALSTVLQGPCIIGALYYRVSYVYTGTMYYSSRPCITGLCIKGPCITVNCITGTLYYRNLHYKDPTLQGTCIIWTVY